MSDDTGEEPDFDYRLTLTGETLAMRDTVQGGDRNTFERGHQGL